MTKKRTYFVSDVHLGSPAVSNNKEREKLFVEWLNKAAMDAEAIYLMGDIFDFWYEYKQVVPKGFVRTLGKIAEITDRGIPVYYFTGNHDIWIFDYFTQELGVEMHRKYQVKEIQGKTFFLAHGDGLEPQEKGYLFLKSIFESKIAQFHFNLLHPDVGMWLGLKWAKQSKVAKIKNPKHDEEKEFKRNLNFVQNFKHHSNIDYFVMGHRHVLRNEKLDENSSIVMLGDWFKYFSFAVFDGEKMEVKTIYDKDW